MKKLLLKDPLQEGDQNYRKPQARDIANAPGNYSLESITVSLKEICPEKQTPDLITSGNTLIPPPSPVAPTDKKEVELADESSSSSSSKSEVEDPTTKVTSTKLEAKPPQHSTINKPVDNRRHLTENLLKASTSTSETDDTDTSTESEAEDSNNSDTDTHQPPPFSVTLEQGEAGLDEKKADLDLEGLHKVAQNILPITKSSLETVQEKVPAFQTVHKVILVAGAVFLLITIGVSIPLGILHPGKVVFEGSGLILTLPLLLTLSSGGGVSLTLIAVGTYLWWVNRKSTGQPQKQQLSSEKVLREPLEE